MKLYLELNEKEAQQILELIKGFEVATEPKKETIAKAIDPVQRLPEVVNYKPAQEFIHAPQQQIVPPQLQIVPPQQQIVPPQQQIVPPQQQIVPPQPQTYTVDALAKMAVQLVDLGRREELTTLLGNFGARSLGELQPTQYENFANFLLAKGCKL